MIHVSRSWNPRALWVATTLTVGAALAIGCGDAAAAQGGTNAAHASNRHPAHVASDFDGDGKPDLAIGEPGASPGGDRHAGAVLVRLSRGGTHVERLIPPQTPHTRRSTFPNGIDRDAAGAALATGDFNGDGYADLAVGAPGYQAPGAPGHGQGAVFIYLGGPSGLTYHAHRLGSAAVNESSSFGDALAAADINHDGFADLVVGNSHRGPGRAWVGQVVAFRGSASGSFTRTRVWNGSDQAGFGSSLATGDFDGDGNLDLAIGEPYADAIAIVSGRSNGLASGVHQIAGYRLGVTGHFGAEVAAGDISGDGVADLVVGAPLASVNGITSAGSVVVIPGSAAGLSTADSRVITARSPGIAGAAQTNAKFGGALRITNVIGDKHADLAIGAPGATISGRRGAGAVYLLRSANAIGAERVTTATSGIPGKPAAGVRFGAGLYLISRSHGARLVIGAPHARTGDRQPGTVTIVPVTKSGLATTAARLVTDKVARSHARFGVTVR